MLAVPHVASYFGTRLGNVTGKIHYVESFKTIKTRLETLPKSNMTKKGDVRA
jgi:hypothetical protein